VSKKISPPGGNICEHDDRIRKSTHLHVHGNKEGTIAKEKIDEREDFAKKRGQFIETY